MKNETSAHTVHISEGERGKSSNQTDRGGGGPLQPVVVWRVTVWGKGFIEIKLKTKLWKLGGKPKWSPSVRVKIDGWKLSGYRKTCQNKVIWKIVK